MNEYPATIISTTAQRLTAAPRGSARLRRRLLLSVSTFAVALCYGGFNSVHPLLALDIAEAAVSDQMDAFADLTPLSDSTLETQRGGFAVGNYNINVGVTVTTSIDGFAQVTTNISVEMPGELQNMGDQIAEIAQEAVAAANTAAVVADAIMESAQAATTADAGDDAAAAGDMATAVVEQAPQVVAQSVNDNQTAAAPQPAPETPAPAEQPQQAAVLPAADTAASVFDAIAAPAPQENAAPAPAVNTAATDAPVTPAQAVSGFVDTVQTEPPAAPAPTPAPAPAQTPAPAAVVVAETPAPAPTPAPAVAVITETPAPAQTPAPVVAEAMPPTAPTEPAPSPAPASIVVAETPTPPETPEPSAVVDAAASQPAPPSAPAVSLPAIADAKSPAPAPSAVGKDDQKVLTLATSPEKLTQVIHSTNANGHVSLVMNTLDNVLIQQTVSMNLTVENFRQVNSLVTLQKSISAISRQIGILSLRH
ncbi:MAG: hypothetical protein H3C28_12000 [Sphingomonadales bacterium]|nr:hypothetical protein [Sphingomonadales bacterium]